MKEDSRNPIQGDCALLETSVQCLKVDPGHTLPAGPADERHSSGG